MDKTIFQKIIDREIPAHIVYEDEHTIAILDIAPKTLGHTLVIPKEFSRTILEMSPEVLGQYFTTVQKVAQAIKNGLEVDGVNIILNTEEAAGQAVFHTHTHIIPRFTNDGVDISPGTHETYSVNKTPEEYAEKIKAQLE